MTLRRTLTISLVALLPFAAAACGDNSDDTAKEAKTTTTVEKTDTTVADGESAGGDETDVTETTAAPDPAAFAAAMDDAEGALAAAGTDLCKIAAAAGQMGANAPSSPEDMKRVYGVYGKTITAVADALPAESAADAQILRDAVEKMMADAEKDGYDVSAFEGEGPAAFSEPEPAAAMERMSQTIGEKCASPADAGTETTEAP